MSAADKAPSETITVETVDKISKLARIRIPEGDREELRQQMTSMLGFVAQLQEVDTDNVTPMSGTGAVKLHLRTDAVDDGDQADALLQNAPEAAHGFFVVPKVVE